MSLINQFLIEFRKNQNLAISYRNRGKWKDVSKEDFLKDIYQMIGYFKENILEDASILVFSYPYSYTFYVSMFAGILSGKRMVIIDSFKNKEKLKHMLDISNTGYALVDQKTKWIAGILPKAIQRLNITKYKRSIPLEECKESARVITFTSATTGMPKMIERDLSFLEAQMRMISSNIALPSSPFVYGMLPMYSLLSIFLGYPTIIEKNPNKVIQRKPSMLLLPISAIERLKKPMYSVTSGFIGGAILYPKETKKILSLLPNCNMTYVYGASEGALIYKTTLEWYKDHMFQFSDSIPEIHVKLDSCPIGEIQIEGNTVIGEGNVHKTGDVGKLDNGVLTILGRKKYTSMDKKFYPYLLDMEFQRLNPKVKESFSMYYKSKGYIFYTGKMENKLSLDLDYIHLKSIPHDLKHKIKADYKALESIIDKRSH